MCRKAGTFIRLEHTIAEGVVLGHLEIGLHLGGIHVKKLRVGRARTKVACDHNLVSAIHLPAIILGDKIPMGVPQVVANTQRTRTQWNRLARGAKATISNVRPAAIRTGS